MKGLHRYEQHLGIEVSNYKFTQNTTKPREPPVSQQHLIYSQTQSASEIGLEQERKAKRQNNNHNKKRVQFAEESLESSIYDTHQVSEEADDSPEDQQQDQEDWEHNDDQQQSIGDKITNKQMIPKEGFNNK